MIGARIPIDAYVGSNPMRNVDRPMTVSVTRKAYLRPMRSPIRPKTSAPNGRTRNPVANNAQVLIRSHVGSFPGKSSADMTAARLPKM